MAYKYFPIKSVILKGTLKQGLVYRLYPNTEFSDGIWNLTISSLSYSLNVNNVNDIFSISCNFIKDHKISHLNEVQNYQQPLGVFHLKSIENDSTKKVIYFDKQWCQINALSNELNFILKNETNENFNYDCDLIIQVLFQRI